MAGPTGYGDEGELAVVTANVGRLNEATGAEVHCEGAFGGDDLFAATRARHDAKGRIISVDDVLQAAPDVIIASWCGKKVKRESLVERFAGTPAVDTDQIYEIPSELILQPGPAALTDGLAALRAILGAVAEGRQLPPRHPGEARRGDL